MGVFSPTALASSYPSTTVVRGGVSIPRLSCGEDRLSRASTGTSSRSQHGPPSSSAYDLRSEDVEPTSSIPLSSSRARASPGAPAAARLIFLACGVSLGHRNRMRSSGVHINCICTRLRFASSDLSDSSLRISFGAFSRLVCTASNTLYFALPRRSASSCVRSVGRRLRRARSVHGRRLGQPECRNAVWTRMPRTTMVWRFRSAVRTLQAPRVQTFRRPSCFLSSLVGRLP